MTKDEIKTAITAALTQHEQNHQAVEESNIPPEFEAIVARALANALGDRLQRIFSPDAK